jgi:GxxExxY protein
MGGGKLMEMNDFTEKAIGCAFKVANTLGSGFLEKVYENAMVLEIQKTGLEVKQQFPVQVKYDGVVIGDFFADLLVEKQVMIELKTVRALDDVHMAQCMNYLRATGIPVCLLINFGRPRIEIKRIVPNDHWKSPKE